MRNDKILLLRNTAVCAVFSTLMIFIGGMIPALSILVLVAANAPMMFLSMRHGLCASSCAALVSVLLFGVISGDIVSAFMTGILSLLPGIVIGRAIEGRFGFSTIIYAGTGILLFGFLLQLILFNAAGNGTGIEDLVNGAIQNVRQVADETFALLGQQSPDKIQEMQKIWNGAIGQTRDMIFLYLPVMVIGISVILSYLILMFGIFVLHKTKTKRIIYRPFWGFVAPRSMCNLVMVLFLITSFSSDSTIWTAALKNMTVLLYGYFAVCGLSLIDYKFRKKISSGYARTAIYLAVFFATYMLIGIIFQGLCILGMIDGVFGFRRFYKAGEKRGQNQ